MKIGLVLEGGSMRGLFTSGILDIMLDNNIKVDTIIGVSAGALFGVNYLSKQRARAIRYNKKYINNKKYISKRNLILTGNMISKEFAYYKMTKELDPFDNETFKNSKIDFYATATDVETGKPAYLKIIDPINQLEELRATSAIPLVSKMIKIGDKKYLDGGVADSIPIDEIQNHNCDKIIVILTQPYNYVKKPVSKKTEKIVKLKYGKYKNLVKAILDRHERYNATLDKIKQLEKENKILVIRPKKNINIDILKATPDDLDDIYNHGVEIGMENINKILEYLSD